MALQRKPLFNPRLVQARLEGFAIPEPVGAKAAVVARWRATLDRGRLEKTKETQLQGLFLVDFFQTVLGYTSLSEGRDVWTCAREETVQVDGKFADGVLGHFTDEHKTYVAAIELKAADADLDTRPSGRRWTAVEQCYQYAINLECDWIIVSNYREIRLYHKNRSQQHYEVFRLETQTDPEELKRFCFLFAAEHVVARKGASVIDRLLEETGEEEEKITHRLYAEYRQIRLDIFDALRRDHPQHDDHVLLEKAQKILDRVLFVCFCEDRGLLPAHIIDRAYEQQNPFAPVLVWRNFAGLFHAVDQGNPPLNIPGYNGGLFAADEVLDGLVVSDDVCERFRGLARYDYAAEVNVDILGHIFEQSISDIENLKAEFAGAQIDRKKSKRKREGVYYTPEQITRYIVEEAVGAYLNARFEELEQRHALDKIPASHTRRRTAAEIEFWTDYRDVLRASRVLDPACGSGAFLIQVFDYLAGEYERCNARLAQLRGGQREIFDLDTLILSNNLYGVDINPEAVEITKLSLWIKTARAGKPLTYLDHNIQCGDSLIDDPEVDPRAFDWAERFPDVTAAGGFDVVVGNPPYVRGERLPAGHKAALQAAYPEVAHGQADLYFYFFERALRLVRPGGALGFITSNAYLRTAAAEPLRRRLAAAGRIRRIVDYVVLKPFEDVDMRPTIIVMDVGPGLPADASHTIRYAAVPSLQTGLSAVVEQNGFETPQSSLDPAGWRFEAPAVVRVWRKIRAQARPLTEVAGRIYSGIKPGRTASFVVPRDTAESWMTQDAEASRILRPYYRGNEIRPWVLAESESLLLRVRNEEDYRASATVKAFLDTQKDALSGRDEAKSGACAWFALRSCDYWDVFESEAIIWPDTAKGPRAALSRPGGIIANTAMAFATDDGAVLALLNSNVGWFAITQVCQNRDERAGQMRYRLLPQHMAEFPLVMPQGEEAERLRLCAERLIALHRAYHEVVDSTLHRVECDLGDGAAIPRNPASPRNLTLFALMAFQDVRREIKRLFKRDIPLNERDEWEGWLRERSERVREIDAEIAQAERELNAIVYRLYDLTLDDIATLESAIDLEPTTPTRRAASRA